MVAGCVHSRALADNIDNSFQQRGAIDAPVIAAPASAAPSEDTSFSFGNTIVISDVDAGAGSETVTLSVGHGTLTLGSIAGLTGLTGNGTGSVSFSPKNQR